ncbi:hypothetical protein CEV34_2045 [Brucella pseudogrignonensis]|uniref:Uncharacterized protein n=1 Tax=Brucella pseudogrignonensis TaxID=419475 RepID=A0A256GL39_9HYPH|nr:hypothetical protein CEV34_2045 [Brucella pseudogrignonensis]
MWMIRWKFCEPYVANPSYNLTVAQKANKTGPYLAGKGAP